MQTTVSAAAKRLSNQNTDIESLRHCTFIQWNDCIQWFWKEVPDCVPLRIKTGDQSTQSNHTRTPTPKWPGFFYCILLLQHLSSHMHFIVNGYRLFSKTNSTDPRQRVPLTNRCPLAAVWSICYLNIVEALTRGQCFWPLSGKSLFQLDPPARVRVRVKGLG